MFYITAPEQEQRGRKNRYCSLALVAEPASQGTVDWSVFDTYPLTISVEYCMSTCTGVACVEAVAR